MCLGLKKKLVAASKKKCNEDISPWIQCIQNHMYYVASSTPDGDSDQMEAKWKMLPLHIQNIHSTCSHPPYADDSPQQLWIKPGY